MSGQVEDIRAPVSANLRAELARLELTKTRAGELLGVSRRQITRWSLGQEPRYEFVVRMAEAFGREPEWFYTDHDGVDRVAA